MASYGWTLEYVLNGLTLPQTLRLFQAIGRIPPTNVLAGMLLKASMEGEDVSMKKLKDMPGVEALTVKGEQFIKMLGVDLGH